MVERAGIAGCGPGDARSPCKARGWRRVLCRAAKAPDTGKQAVKQCIERLPVPTRGPSLIDITSQTRKFVAATKIVTGVLTLFIQHTSASLLIQENADSDVL